MNAKNDSDLFWAIRGGGGFGIGGGAAGIVILRYAGGEAPAGDESAVPLSWLQAVARASKDHACEPGWSASWDYWPNTVSW